MAAEAVAEVAAEAIGALFGQPWQRILLEFLRAFVAAEAHFTTFPPVRLIG